MKTSGHCQKYNIEVLFNGRENTHCPHFVRITGYKLTGAHLNGLVVVKGKWFLFNANGEL